ncbi:hypothetical protein MAE02_62510 [Microvirga aerophila]|uniref:Uncharacterized protein n=2 Tax=Microvirga aerophila TaxID=670291 RepID=A0A512C2W6_9HYPH|nr:hypothetical protein MAE02_62510 [Microvirga aerophila]
MPGTRKTFVARRDEAPQDRMYSPELQALMWEILRTLSQIDAEHHLRLEEVERGATEDELKEYVRRKLTAAHRARREPYLNQLEKLRQQQHRQSFGI